MNRLLAQTSTSPGGVTIQTEEGNFTLESPLRSEITDISSIVNILISFLLPLALIILFLMFVYSGFTFITAKGASDKIEKAQKIMMSSLAGIILLVISFFLVRILAAIFGLDGGGILPS